MEIIIGLIVYTIMGVITYYIFRYIWYRLDKNDYRNDAFPVSLGLAICWVLLPLVLIGIGTHLLIQKFFKKYIKWN